MSAHTPLAKELTRRDREQIMAKRNMDRTQGASIFDEEIKDPGREKKKAEMVALGKEAAEEGEEDEEAVFEDSRGHVPSAGTKVKEHMERADDPDPRWRVRFLRKKVMQMVRNQDKPLTRAERIRLTEKDLRSVSPTLPTSTKKLMFLSHQIVGKTVDDAITQMQFSKKKIAREVKWQLEEARDTAIAARGMGLGSGRGAAAKAAAGGAEKKKRMIQTKDGRWIEVQDPTTLYVDESWVTKGPFRGMRIQYHARSRMSRMWKPTASISLVLKEEKTRIRLHEERLAKEAEKKPWVHLPNRPVTAQRPYYSW